MQTLVFILFIKHCKLFFFYICHPIVRLWIRYCELSYAPDTLSYRGEQNVQTYVKSLKAKISYLEAIYQASQFNNFTFYPFFVFLTFELWSWPARDMFCRGFKVCKCIHESFHGPICCDFIELDKNTILIICSYYLNINLKKW